MTRSLENRVKLHGQESHNRYGERDVSGVAVSSHQENAGANRALARLSLQPISGVPGLYPPFCFRIDR
jgi:hypothetical protein